MVCDGLMRAPARARRRWFAVAVWSCLSSLASSVAAQQGSAEEAPSPGEATTSSEEAAPRDDAASNEGGAASEAAARESAPQPSESPAEGSNPTKDASSSDDAAPAIGFEQAPTATDEVETQSDEPRELGEVVVRAKREEVSVETLQGAAPVEVITADDIKNSGAETLSGVLQRLVPSANMPLGAANTVASTRVAKSISLHGLGPDQTLILIDGKRRHLSGIVNTALVFGRGSHPVDLNLIPLSAIERIEILRDGSSAQYGSDATAGVVNIVLRKNDSGGELSALAGNYLANDKPKGPPTTSSVFEGWAGFKLGEGGYINFSFNVAHLYHPIEARPDGRRFYFDGDPREETVDRTQWLAHFPADERSYKFLVSAAKDIDENFQAYGFYNYGNSFKQGRNFFTLPSADANVRAIYPDGYGARSQSTVNDHHGVLGLRYDDEVVGGFDVSAAFGLYDQQLDNDIGVNAGLGLNSPIGYHHGGYRNSQYGFDLSWRRSFGGEVFRNPFEVAAGANLRYERYEIQAGEPASYQKGEVILDGPNAGNLAPSAGGLTPEDAGLAKRRTEGIWVNLEKRVVDPLLLGVAGRFDNYSDFGFRPTGKLWARYDVFSQLSVRASAGTSYRAPSLGQIRYSTTGYIADNQTGDFVQNRGLPVDSPVARALGARDLKPETSRSYTAGVVWEPGEDLTLSADVYQIEIDDRITLSENLTGPFVGSLLAAAGYPEVRTASFFLNALDTRTRGIDLAGRYTLDLERSGRFDLSVAVSAFRTKVTDKVKNPPELAGSDVVLTSRRVVGLYTRSSPENKLLATLRYRLGGLEVTLTQKRYGEYRELHPSEPKFDQTYSAQYLTDIAAAYHLKNGLSLTLGVNNIFDSRPDEQRPELSVGGFGMSRYSDLAPEGMDGTYYFGRLGYRF